MIKRDRIKIVILGKKKRINLDSIKNNSEWIEGLKVKGI